jgi:hypothetical protein
MVAASVAAAAVFALRAGILSSWGHGAIPQLTNTLATEDHGDAPIELLTTQQNAPDVRELSRAIADAARASAATHDTTIVLDTSFGFGKGWGWYLRDYPHLTLVDMRTPYDAPAGAIVLADARNRSNVHVSDGALAVTFTKRWAFPAAYDGLSRDEIVSRLVSVDAWSAWYGYLSDRTSVGQPAYSEGVAYFPESMSATVRLPRQSDVLSAKYTPPPPAAQP